MPDDRRRSGFSAVQGGVRMPKLRMSTVTVPSTTSGTVSRGTMIRGLGVGTPGASWVCSQISARLLGAASMLRNSSGSGGSAVRPLEVRVGAVVLDVVDAHEPGVLGVAQMQLAVTGLQARVAHRHVVGNRAQVAGARGQVDRAHVVAQDIAAEDERAVRPAVGVFEHLALARAARALVHEGDDVVVGRDDLDGRAVGDDPALVLADVDEDAVDALLGARPRIEVVAEELVQVGLGAAVVDDDLAAVEMRVAEGRRDVDDRPRDEVLAQVVGVEDPLKQREAEGEEAGVGGSDDGGGDAGLGLAGDEREDDEVLLGQPLEASARGAGRTRCRSGRDSGACRWAARRRRRARRGRAGACRARRSSRSRRCAPRRPRPQPRGRGPECRRRPRRSRPRPPWRAARRRCAQR